MPSKTQKPSMATATIVEDTLAAGQDGVEALRESGARYLEGYGQIGASYLAFLQDTAERSAEAAKAMFAAKSVQDVMDVQIDFAQQRFDSFVAESTKISEMSMKTMNEAMTPLRKRFDDNVAKVVETTSA